MSLLGKALCSTALFVVTTVTLAGPLAESQHQLFAPLENQAMITGNDSYTGSSLQPSTTNPFDSLETDTLNTSSAFIEADSAIANDIFSEQSYDKQALIINIKE